MAVQGVRAVFFSVALGAAAIARASAPGLLDPTFAAGGVARTLIPDPAPLLNQQYLFRGAAAFGIAVQPDGKLVTAGEVGPSSGGFQLVLMRHDDAGTLDPTFGSGGVVVTSYQRSRDHYGAAMLGGIVLQPDGRIVVAFTLLTNGSPPAYGLALARFNADGSVDGSFGSSGIAHTAGPAGDGFGAALVRDSGGGFVVAGYQDTPYPSQTPAPVFLLARFDASGILDPAFGTGGLVTTDFGVPSKAFALVRQPDGGLVAAGEAGGDFALARYDGSGSLDGTFGTGGMLTTDVGGHGSARALLLQPDADIVAGGRGDAGFPVVRYDSTGALDPGFGSGGIATASVNLVSTGVPPVPPGVTSLVLEPDGRLVGAGQNSEVRVLLRWRSEGTLDPTFGSGGVVRTYVDEQNGFFLDPAAGLVRLADGRILTADREGDGGRDAWTVTRYLGGRCGNGVTEAGEDCDGGGCPSTCCLADGDGDGICDAVDPCTGPASATRPRLSIRWHGQGKSTFALMGETTLAHPFTPALDPSVNGIRIRVPDAVGSLLDVTLPPGVFTTSGGSGWKVGAGKWTYVDKRLQRPFGIRRAIVQDASNVSPGLVRFSVQSKSDTYASFRLNLPLTAEVVLHGAVSANGQCTDVVFPGSPPCVYTPIMPPRYDSLVCR